MKKLMKVEGMRCAGCSGRVKRTLEAMPGVQTPGPTTPLARPGPSATAA